MVLEMAVLRKVEESSEDIRKQLNAQKIGN